MASGTHLEHMGGRGDPELLEEDLGHHRVVVLAGVHEHRLERLRASVKLGEDRRHLHEVGPRANDG